MPSLSMNLGISNLLGGKRRRRTDLARAERDLAGLDYEAKRLEVASAVASGLFSKRIT